MKNYVQEGDRIQITAGADIASGGVVVIGTKIGVACNAIANGATGICATEGVFTLPKLSTDVIAQGALVYWDASPGEITTTSSGNTVAGYATAAAGNGVTTINVCINR